MPHDKRLLESQNFRLMQQQENKHFGDLEYRPKSLLQEPYARKPLDAQEYKLNWLLNQQLEDQGYKQSYKQIFGVDTIAIDSLFSINR